MQCPKCKYEIPQGMVDEYGYIRLNDDEKYHILLALKNHYKGEWCSECSSVEKKLQIKDAELSQALHNAILKGEGDKP